MEAVSFMSYTNAERLAREAAPAFREPYMRQRIGTVMERMYANRFYRVLLLIAGLPVHLVAGLVFFAQKRHDPAKRLHKDTIERLRREGLEARLEEEIRAELERKYRFFGRDVRPAKLEQEARKLAAAAFLQEAAVQTEAGLRSSGAQRVTYVRTFRQLLENPLFRAWSWVAGCLMVALLLIYARPYLKYVFDRLWMMVFVIFGVTFLVFTILYLSPLDPAANILGQTATQDQIARFNEVYGLDRPYVLQLWNAFRGIVTFDLGKSFAGNELVSAEIIRKLPITLQLTFLSLIIGAAMALPSGLISATRQYSFFDYSFMLLVLIGLSIPDFWQGLVSILYFSIKLDWLPATYSPQNGLSLLMPAFVLGTGLAASVARMTRSSTLEVIHQDYVVTARAKGLSEGKVILKHALGNALIPIVTVIGLQFGGMLGGAAVTEKIFNISGIGSYIVDKQFVPDIPGILAGVIYVAVTISAVNLLVDLLYAFLDPRIRSKMRDY